MSTVHPQYPERMTAALGPRCARHVFPFAILLFLLSILSAGCAIEDGKPLAEAHFSLEAVLATDAPVDSPNIYLTGDGVAVTVSAVAFRITEMALISASASGEGITFDPENPPAPYTNCHAGHCHSTESDALYTYAEIEASLGGSGNASESVLARLETSVAVTLSALNTAVVAEIPDVLDMSAGEIGAVRVTLGEVSFVGMTEDGQVMRFENLHGHGESAHREPVVYRANASRTINREAAYHQTFGLVWTLDADFIDDLVNAASGDDVEFTDVISSHSSLSVEHDHASEDEHDHASEGEHDHASEGEHDHAHEP